MSNERIKYIFENWDNLKWNPESYQKFVNELSTINIGQLDPVLQEKVKAVLSNDLHPSDATLEAHSANTLNAPNIVQVSDEDELLEIYIGNNSDKILGGKVVWGAVLFGASWLMYRKAYLLTLLFTIFNSVIQYLLVFLGIPYFVLFIIMVIINLVLLPPLYIKDARKKIAKLKEQHKSLDNESLRKEIQHRGGTNGMGVVLFYVLYIGVMILVYYASLLGNTHNFYGLEATKPDNWVYNGRAYKDANNHLCYFEISALRNYYHIDEAKDFVKETLPGLQPELNTVSISGIEWNEQIAINGNTHLRVLYAIRNDKLYVIQFSTRNYNSNSCASDFKYIENTLQWK